MLFNYILKKMSRVSESLLNHQSNEEVFILKRSTEVIIIIFLNRCCLIPLLPNWKREVLSYVYTLVYFMTHKYILVTLKMSLWVTQCYSACKTADQGGEKERLNIRDHGSKGVKEWKLQNPFKSKMQITYLFFSIQPSNFQ